MPLGAKYSESSRASQKLKPGFHMIVTVGDASLRQALGYIGDDCVKWKHFLNDVADQTGTVRVRIERVEMSLKPGFHMIVTVGDASLRQALGYIGDDCVKWKRFLNDVADQTGTVRVRIERVEMSLKPGFHMIVTVGDASLRQALGYIGDDCVKWKHFLNDVADQTGTVRVRIERVEMSLKPGFHMIVTVGDASLRQALGYIGDDCVKWKHFLNDVADQTGTVRVRIERVEMSLKPGFHMIVTVGDASLRQALGYIGDDCVKWKHFLNDVADQTGTVRVRIERVEMSLKPGFHMIVTVGDASLRQALGYIGDDCVKWKHFLNDVTDQTGTVRVRIERVEMSLKPGFHMIVTVGDASLRQALGYIGDDCVKWKHFLNDVADQTGTVRVRIERVEMSLKPGFHMIVTVGDASLRQALGYIGDDCVKWKHFLNDVADQTGTVRVRIERVEMSLKPGFHMIVTVGDASLRQALGYIGDDCVKWKHFLNDVADQTGTVRVRIERVEMSLKPGFHMIVTVGDASLRQALGYIGDDCVKWKHFLNDVADQTGTVRVRIERVEMSLKSGFHMILTMIVYICRRLIRTRRRYVAVGC